MNDEFHTYCMYDNSDNIFAFDIVCMYISCIDQYIQGVSGKKENGALRTNEYKRKVPTYLCFVL